jgi:acyl-CoA thioesterase
MSVQPNFDANGTPCSFAILMALEKVDENTFRSLTAAFEPGGGVFERPPGMPPRAFGGHVYAQAVWAAAQTVGGNDGKGAWVVHVCK